MLIVTALAVIALLQQQPTPLPLAPQAQPAQPGAPLLELPRLALDSPIDGELVDGDPVVETPTLQEDYANAAVVGRAFLFEVVDDGPFTIELRSYFFDAYLIVRNAAGDLLAEDDDGLLRTHACVGMTGRKAGELLRFEACALHGERGSFTLTARAGEPVELDSKEEADAIAADVDRTIAAVRARFGDDSLEYARACSRCASDLEEIERFYAAQLLLEQEVAILEKVCGPDDLDIGCALNNLANVLADERRYSDARPLYERALAIHERILGPEDADIAACLNGLAWLVREQGDLATARSLYERVLAIREHALGPDDPETARTLNNLAGVLDDQGECAAAQLLYERALRIYETVQGPESADIGRVMSNLALVLKHEGNYSEAQRLAERALAITEKACGPDDPTTATRLNNLALIFRNLGNFTEARPLYERALAIDEAALGADHSSLVPDLNNLALLLLDLEDYSAAEPLCRRALSIAEHSLGPDHPDTAWCLSTLGELLEDQGNSVEAGPLYERALAIREKVLGPAHPDTATSLSDVANLLEDQGELTAARRLYERMLAIDEATYGPEHPELAGDFGCLGRLLREEGDLAGARLHHERALAIREKVLGPEHPRTARSLRDLACVLADQGSFVAARRMLERALLIDEKVFGSQHSDATYDRRKLTYLTLDSGEPERAFEYAAAAFDATRAQRTSSPTPPADWENFQRAALEFRCVDALLDVAHAAGDRSKETAAYDALLSWKGGVRDGLCESRRRMLASLDDETRREVDDLRGVQSRLSEEVARIDVGDAAAHEALLALLRQRRGDLERELARRLGPDRRADDVTAAELAALLLPRSALVDFLLHKPYLAATWQDGQLVEGGRVDPPSVTAWVVPAGAAGATRIELGEATPLRQAVEDYLSAITSARAATPPDGGREQEQDRLVSSTGAALRELLWKPLAPHLGDVDLLFIAPDRFLETLPFETIPLEDGSYLVEKRSVVYVTSGSALARTLRRPKSALERTAGAALVAGGFDYEARDESLDGADAPPVAHAATASPTAADSALDALRGGLRRSWEPLRFTGQEAETVAALRRGSVEIVRGAVATEASLKKRLPGKRYVHLATHGFFQPEGLTSLWESALALGQDDGGKHGEHGVRRISERERITGLMPGLLTGLVCAGANRPVESGRENGLLTAEEITWLDLSACDLVVLSACETGLGKDRGGEGMFSLRASFELAGAKTVIATLWNVNDKATSELMADFYRRLWVAGEPTGAALRRAQLDLIARGLPPSTWGAFTLAGEWR